MDTFNYRGFKKLLQRAIGDETNVAFAKASGISAVHLSRMLNADEKTAAKPSISTLQKIAGAGAGRVTIHELKVVCGYEDEEESTEIISDKCAKAKGKQLANEICALVKEETEIAVVLSFSAKMFGDNIQKRLEENNINAVTSPEFFDFDDDENYSRRPDYQIRNEGADLWIMPISYTVPGGHMISFELMFYIEVSPEGYVLCCTADKEFQIVKDHDTDYRGSLAHRSKVQTNDETARLIAKENNLSYGKVRLQMSMAPESLSKYGIKVPFRPVTVEGIGFYIDRTTPRMYLDFIIRHRKAFAKTEIEQKRLDDLIEYSKTSPVTMEKLNEILKGLPALEPNMGDEPVGIAVCNIIFREQNIYTEYWNNHLYDNLYPNRPSIMITDCNVWDNITETMRFLTHDTAMHIMDDYASELHSKAEETFFVMERPLED